jgi:hypothetical protein
MDINHYIDISKNLAGNKPTDVPVIDRTASASFGLELANRMNSQFSSKPDPFAKSEVKQMPIVMPVAN